METVNNLQDASLKLSQLIELQKKAKNSSSPDENHKYAILFHYLEDIKNSISEVVEKISDVYETVYEYENDSNLSYKDLYHNEHQKIKNETKFLEAFGPYMSLWHTLS